ncbi:ricin B lectin domain-containing protein [Coprinopsis sp. MPI-PUGE-AT-0042]|nr:ricin B lectin domain-containing protein [Coprinopsis sp. MPI-PUGE-AT-0042]
MHSSTSHLCVLLAIVRFGVGPVLAAPLRACQNYLVSDGTTYKLVVIQDMSPWIQCEYFHDNGDGSGSGTYCFYKAPSYDLVHYPDTPLRVDSNPACPSSAPPPSIYRIRSLVDETKCITAAGEYDGAPVELQACRTDIWRPEQVFHFDGDLIKPLATDKCLDVKDGNPNSGTKLQVWTCSTNNPNQRFGHWVPNILVVPEDHINWAAQPSQCLDLTNGNTAPGTPIQIWGCGYQNPNQHWRLEPVV